MAPAITATNIPGTVGVALSTNITASGVPTSYAISSGALPGGLTLNTTSGAITGTPTESVTNRIVSVTASNSVGTGSPGDLTFNIAKGAQTITNFPGLRDLTVGGSPLTLAAGTASGLTVTYASSNSAVASVSGNTLTAVAPGITTIVASQTGDANWNAAPDVFQSVKVTAAPLVAWDFNGESSPATSTADVFDSNLDSSALMTRGTGAAASSGGNSFRTTGFLNNGISTANTDYFEFQVSAKGGFTMSLSSIDARFVGTASFYAAPGVSMQFGYSTNGTDFILIGSPTITTAEGSIPAIDLSGISALQGVPAGTTVTFRYYASGQTATGGWGFSSPVAGQYGLAVGGTLQALPPGTPLITPSGNLTGLSYIGSGPSTAQSVTLMVSDLTNAPGSLTVTGSSSFEVSTTDANSGFGSSATLAYADPFTLASNSIWVRLKAGLTNGTYGPEIISVEGGGGSAAFTATGTATVPSLTLNTTNLGTFTATNGIASAARPFAVTGTNLTANVLVTPPAGFEVSTGTNAYAGSLLLAPTAGILASTTVNVRLAATNALGAVATNNIVVSSTGAVDRTVQVAGSVVNGTFTLAVAPTSLTEGGAPALLSATLSTNAPAGGVTITITSNDTDGSEVELSGTTLTVEAGATNSTTPITVTPKSDGIFDLAQTVVFTGTAPDWASAGTVSVTVVNKDAAAVSYVSITSTNPAAYTQNFDGLGTTTIAGAFSPTSGTRESLSALLGAASLDGWYAGKLSGGGSSALALTASTGADTGAGFYNFGSAGNSDRALGTLASGTTIAGFGAMIKNDTASTLTGLKISFTAEFWRSCTGTTNVLTFGFGKVDGTIVTTDNFLTNTNANRSTNLNIVGPAPLTSNGSLDGNFATNQVAIVDQLIPVNLAPGEIAFIRWQDANEDGNDAGLAIDNFSITAEANPLLAPEFDVLGGVYLTDQTVRISNYLSYPVGAEVRYTVDGTTPGATSTLYNDATGILIVQGNGPINLRAVAIQPESGGSSAVASVTYSLPKNVANLTELRASTADNTTVYRVQGPIVLSGQTANRNTKFFQDSGAGIQIDDFSAVITNTYSVGDGVQGALGRISFFQGQLQFVPYQDFGPAVSSNNALTPVSRTLTSLSDADQARLVIITGVEFQTNTVGTGFGITRTNLPIKDPSTASSTNAFSGFFRHLFIDGDLSAATIPAGSGTVTGVVQKLSITGVTNLTVAARTTADLSFSGVTPDTTPPVITIVVENPLTVLWGGTWLTDVYQVSDNVDGTNVPVTFSNTVDTKVPGSYIITYTARDSSSNTASTNLIVNVRFAGGGTNRGPEGLPDAVRFALGADGTNAMNPVLMPTSMMSNNALVLNYHGRPGTSPVELVPVVSTDLANSNSWSTAGITVTNLGQTNVNGVTLDRRQASVPTTDGTRKFLRLRATTSQ